MGRRRKVKLKYKKERVLLSDVLPYELPIIMSNRMFYRFCVKNKIQYCVEKNCLSWNKNIDADSKAVLKLIFGPAWKEDNVENDVNDRMTIALDNYNTIPFIFHILHKEHEYRALSIVHPAMQVGMTHFYDKNKSLIIHFCSRSNFSLRYPQKIASFFYYRDRLHHKLLGVKKDKIELFFNEYENLKTFFSYKKYTQIYRFYDDYRFQKAEKRFSNLLRFDIQKCFDSIYTHTIAWATQGGKKNYKLSFLGRDHSSFGGAFDTMMQRLNYNETSGIVIGPEFSRIFAEIILQYIDRAVESQLEGKKYINGKDYQLYRYVDDYFLFYNEPKVREQVIALFHRNFEDYRLKIGREKTMEYERPFLTDISRAKIRIDALISNWFRFRSCAMDMEERDRIDEDKDVSDNFQDKKGDKFIPNIDKLRDYLNLKGYYPLVSRKFNQEFKDCIISVGVKSKDVLNYTLSCIDTRVERELRKFIERYEYVKTTFISENTQISSTVKEECVVWLQRMEAQITNYLIDVVDTVFFLFALNRRVNSTLKLSKILNTIIIFLNGNIRFHGNYICRRFDKKITYPVFNQIYNEVLNTLRFSKCHDYAQLELLYLLIVMRTLNNSHPLPEEILIENLNLENKESLNSIAINVILYYIGNKSQYSTLKSKLIEHVVKKVEQNQDADFRKNTELLIFILDLGCCPYVAESDKIDIMTRIGMSPNDIRHILSYGRRNKYFFTKWDNVDITKELASKISQEVYS